jgi:hypothetical protein
VQFAGIYRSTFGDVRLRQQPGSVEGTYPGGTLKCASAGPVLDCDWREGTATGKARLTREATGDLVGTWGNGLSNSSGGPWRFNLLSAGDPGPSGMEATAGSFAGAYTSTFGVVTLVETQGRVTGRYPGGTLDCVPAGAVLACGWREGTLTGRAKLTRQMNGDLSGTWGGGASDSSGGPWLFRRR